MSWLKKLSKIPSRPGVYFFKNKKKEIIYIGKSVNLKNRIKSYFQNKSLGFHTQKMVTNIKSIDWQVCRSEFEALLLEVELINKYQPFYNIQFKDDKSFIVIAFSNKKYPRVYTAREKDQTAVYYGPFPSAGEVKKVLKLVRQIFPFRSCKRLLKKPCLYFHLKLCPGCCLGYSKKAYQKTIKKIIKFLKGNTKSLVKQLEKEMKQASQALNFEKAGKIKQQIKAIDYVTRHWQSLDQKSLSLSLAKDMKSQVLSQAEKIFSQLSRLERIEAYDVSNFLSQSATGSMVVFKNLKPFKNDYRKFKIRLVSRPDDPAMIREVVSRRLKRKEWPYPDLMIVDGGKGQVSAAFSQLRKDNLDHKIFLLGLAKKEETIIKPLTKKRTIIAFQEIKLAKDSEFLKLLQNLRNESHRFAKKYHLWLRKQSIKK